MECLLLVPIALVVYFGWLFISDYLDNRKYK